MASQLFLFPNIDSSARYMHIERGMTVGEYEQALLGTGLFYPSNRFSNCYSLVNTSFYLSFIYGRGWFCSNGWPKDVTLSMSFEEILDRVEDEELQARLLFHLDLFV